LVQRRPTLIAGAIVVAVIAAGLQFNIAGPAVRAGKPARIVSLNLCTDEMVLRLADRENVASVTWLSRDPANSNVAGLAAQVPINHGLAEEVIPLDPDFIVAGIYTARTAIALLKRAGMPVQEVGVANSIDEVRKQYRDVADMLGERERGEQVIAAMDRRLAALANDRPAKRPRAVVLNPNGVTVGPGTLADDIMTRAGFENLAATLKIDNYGTLSLETIATNEVDVVIVSGSRDGPPAMATEVLKHPVLAALKARTRIAVMPNRLWNCGGPALVDAIELLARVAAEVRGEAAPQ
jgi:iron complex transport system substrate-binding protein